MVTSDGLPPCSMTSIRAWITEVDKGWGRGMMF